jgi:hypothetical protein
VRLQLNLRGEARSDSAQSDPHRGFDPRAGQCNRRSPSSRKSSSRIK